MIGNPPPRLWETAAGMLNAIGLQNIGAAAFLEEKLPKLRQITNITVFANIFGYTREDYDERSRFSTTAKASRPTNSMFLALTQRTVACSSGAIGVPSMKW